LRDPQDVSVGKYLRQERERKGLSLEAVSQATRISSKSLEAIESDDFISLPAPIFIRGFLKTYASFIGLEPYKVIALYETQTGIIGLPAPKGLQPEKRIPRRIWLLAIPILIIVLIGGGVYWLASPRKVPPSPSVAPPPPAPVLETGKTPLPPLPPPPVKESPKAPEKMAKARPEKKPELPVTPAPPKILTPPPAASGEASGEGKKEQRQILRVQAKEQTWVRVQTDDQPEFEVLLEPQEKAVWTARRQLKIILGNAAGLDMAFNGKRVGPFGGKGQVVHLQFPLPEGKKGNE
jgi:cytoskeleton protein RodZ